MNSVVLIGRLARDPELSYTPNKQTAVCHFTLAVDRPRRNGEDRGADFLRITVYGRVAENCNNYLAKGRQAAVHGRIETGSYKNREGVTVYTTDIIADNVEFLGNAPGGNGGNASSPYGDSQPARQAAPQMQNGASQQPAPQMQGQIGNMSNLPPQMPTGGYPPQGMQSQQMTMPDIPDSFEAAEDDIPF